MFAQTKRTATMAGAAAVIAAAFAAAPASAQSARYCDGNLVANSFYSNVLSNGSTATVQYHGQFQNTDPQRRRISATLLQMQRIGNFTILRPMGRLDLNAYEQKDVVIFSVQTNNPGGAGAPTPALVGQTIRFACHFVQ
ncbi:hypothetical protein ACE7GA_20715 [Roseomonas sp. CCTCC AB2023176]|uniref:hypothetical protein n=1 Tax=Roseomonas sp. CCTCC AB2023176 TaxID=3342640 RepID=UPI0035DABB47